MWYLFEKMKPRSGFDGLIENLLSEGMTSSYNTPLLIDNIKKLFNNNLINVNYTDFEKTFGKTKYGTIFTITIVVKNYHIYEQKLQQIINLFGYYVSSNQTQNKTNIIQIEPRYPVDITKKLQQWNIKYGYHVTHKSNFEKIQEIGLAPKISQTDFMHPGNRIYLAYSDNKQILMSLKKILANHRQMNSADFILLKIKLHNGPYYLDDTATSISAGLIAFFTLNNISPKYIALVN